MNEIEFHKDDKPKRWRRLKLGIVGACIAGVLAGLWLALGETVHEVLDSNQATTTARHMQATIQRQSVSSKNKRLENVIRIPSIGIQQPVYTTPSGLNKGVYGSGDLNNNYVVAGHSSYVSGVWFSNLFKLQTTSGYVVHDGAPYRPADYKGGKGSGGLVYLYTHDATYTYQADDAYTVEATDTTVTAQGSVGDQRQLHLYTCPYTKYKYPPFRYVVQAHLVKVRLTAAGKVAGTQTQLTVK